MKQNIKPHKNNLRYYGDIAQHIFKHRAGIVGLKFQVEGGFIHKFHFLEHKNFGAKPLPVELKNPKVSSSEIVHKLFKFFAEIELSLQEVDFGQVIVALTFANSVPLHWKYAISKTKRYKQKKGGE